MSNLVQVARVDLSSAMVNRFRNAARGAEATESPGYTWWGPWEKVNWTKRICGFIADLW